MTKIRCLPAEWTPQQGVMLAWPHEQTDWSQHLYAARDCVARICVAISKFETVYLLHAPDDHSFMPLLKHYDTHIPNLVFISCLFNDTWVRDYGAISVFQNKQAYVLNFHFNAWGEKYAYELDDQVNHKLKKIKFFKAKMADINVVLEGGSIESDGCGTLMTTAQCMRQRHATLSDAEITNKLKCFFGVKRIFMLEHGYLIGDDTDAHIDTLARFCSPTSMVYMHCDDEHDEHYEALQAMQAELRCLRTLDGQAYQLYPLPWPKKVLNDKGQRLAASYANFLIINDAVLMPSYALDSDEQAKKVLEHCFPDRTIIPIACEVLIEQGGSLHCMSMQFPKGFVI